MRRLLLLITTSGLLAFGACGPAAPVADEPAVRPSASPSLTPSVSPSVSPSPSAAGSATPAKSEDTDDESVEEQGDDTSGEDDTSFTDPYVYRDGLEVEVTKLRHGSVTADDVEAGARAEKGTAWVQLTVRVTNRSKHRTAEPVGDFELSYGPDKDVADPVSLPTVRNRGLSGSIARGEAKVTSATFVVPVKDQDDVVLGFTPDIDHDTAYFTGSIA